MWIQLFCVSLEHSSKPLSCEQTLIVDIIHAGMDDTAAWSHILLIVTSLPFGKQAEVESGMAGVIGSRNAVELGMGRYHHPGYMCYLK